MSSTFRTLAGRAAWRPLALALALLIAPLTVRAQELEEPPLPPLVEELPAIVSDPDAFGYTFHDSVGDPAVPFGWVEDVREPGGVVISLAADDSFRAGIPLGFAFPFYGITYDTIWISTNGVVGFGRPVGPTVSAYVNERLPAPRLGPAVAAYWDDLYPVSDRRIAYRSYGEAPGRVFVAEWQSDVYFADARRYPAIQVLLHEDGRIRVQYAGEHVEDRGSATIGVQNENASIALVYAHNQPAAQVGLAVEFVRPAAPAVAYVPPPVPAPLALSACQQSVQGGFRQLLQSELQVNRAIGCPRGDERPFLFSQQEFEGGHMLYRPDTGQIVVTFADESRWAAFPDPYAGEPEPEPEMEAPEGRQAPTLGFGKLWRDHPGLRERLGWALAPERYFQGTLQEFTGGTLIWTGMEQWLLRSYLGDGAALVILDPDQAL